MKKIIAFFIALSILLSTIGFPAKTIAQAPPPLTDAQLLDKTEAQAARYFWDRVLTNGFVKNGEFSLDSSIAATGFGLAALVVMAERYNTTADWTITPSQARSRAQQILDAAVAIQAQQSTSTHLYGKKGFLYHFIYQDGTRSGDSEVSTVDTALLAAGALTAGQYFGGEVEARANTFFDNIDWSYFLDSQNKLFYLGWKPNQSTNFNIPAPDGDGYLSSKIIDGSVRPAQWDQPTDEVIIINILALASNPTSDNFRKSLYAWPRVTRSYGGYNVVNSYFGSLFTYIYGQIFFDFKAMGLDSPIGASMSAPQVNWFDNAKNAILANRQYVIDQSPYFPTYGPNQWGLSASYAPDGSYLGDSGAKPATVNGGEPNHYGVIPPYASIGTMPLLRTAQNEPLSSNLAFAALRNYYDNHFNGLWGTYGPHDSLWTPVGESTRYSNIYLGIDKGVEVLMIENYRTGLINKYFMSHPKVYQAVKMQFPNYDTDNDRMPDAYEQGYGCLNPLVADGKANPDSDGLKNFAEMTIGTNPCVTNPEFALDSDNDAFTNGIEQFMGTDPQDNCADNSSDPAFPPDMNNDKKINVGDILAGFYGKILTPANYTRRSDFDADGDIDTGDIIIGYNGRMLTSCQ